MTMYYNIFIMSNIFIFLPFCGYDYFLVYPFCIILVALQQQSHSGLELPRNLLIKLVLHIYFHFVPCTIFYQVTAH